MLYRNFVTSTLKANAQLLFYYTYRQTGMAGYQKLLLFGDDDENRARTAHACDGFRLTYDTIISNQNANRRMLITTLSLQSPKGLTQATCGLIKYTPAGTMR